MGHQSAVSQMKPTSSKNSLLIVKNSNGKAVYVLSKYNASDLLRLARCYLRNKAYWKVYENKGSYDKITIERMG